MAQTKEGFLDMARQTRRLLLLVAACMALTLAAPRMALAADAAGGEAKGTLHLFNGKNLDGFYTFVKDRGRNQDPKKVFTVENGAIRISGEEWGCITTNSEFENYRVTIEFKWGTLTHANRLESARDSGLLVHSTGADGAYAGVWMRSIECQMIEGGTGDLLVVGDETPAFSLTTPTAPELQDKCPVYQAGGKPATIDTGRINWWGRDPQWKDVKGFRGAKDVEKPLGEWNRYECIADGAKLTVLLNGKVVNEAFDVRPAKGRIQIQSEGAELFVRRVDVTPLAADKAAAPPKP